MVITLWLSANLKKTVLDHFYQLLPECTVQPTAAESDASITEKPIAVLSYVSVSQ